MMGDGDLARVTGEMATLNVGLSGGLREGKATEITGETFKPR